MSEDTLAVLRFWLRVAGVMVLLGFFLMTFYWANLDSSSSSSVPPIGWVILVLGLGVLAGAVQINAGRLGLALLIVSSLASALGVALLAIAVVIVLTLTDAARYKVVGTFGASHFVVERGLFGRVIAVCKNGMGVLLVGFFIGLVANSLILGSIVRERLLAPPEAQTKGRRKRPCPLCGRKIPAYAKACKHCKSILEDDD
jgi:hypothetical protein